MSQYAHDGGQHSAMFGYVAEWPTNASALNSFPEHLNQQTILNQDENNLMTAFFQNPDAASVGNNFAGDDWFSDLKLDTSALQHSLHGFDDNTETVSNPAVTLAGASAGSYETHAHQHLPIAGHINDFHGHEPIHTSEDDLNAASRLFNMSTHSQEQSHGQNLHTMAPASSWGSIAAHQPMVAAQDSSLHSPATSSGRQSSNSYRSQTHHPLANNQHQMHLHNRMPQQQSQQWQRIWQQQPSSTPRVQHVQHAPTHLQNQYSFFPPHSPIHTPQSALPRLQTLTRSPTMQYGNDPSFGNGAFRPPSGFPAVEEEKAANLNNVPLADQVAAHGPFQMPAFTPGGHQRAYQRHSVPSTSTNFYGTNVLPANFGGLPVSSQTSTTHLHGHPHNHMARHTTRTDDIDNDQAMDSPQPRKRRKSQMERDEDAEYSPYGHAKPSMTRRGLKAANDSDDENDDYAITPSNIQGSIKRRKPSMAARASPDSEEEDDEDEDEDGSPSAMASDGVRRSGGGRRKSRSAQARQNLTEDQKRMNHIRSEKTRRDLIKIQYDTLDELVPALKAGKSGLSRSDILNEIVSFVECTASGNRAILKKLMSANNAEPSNASFG